MYPTESGLYDTAVEIMIPAKHAHDLRCFFSFSEISDMSVKHL